MSDPGVQQGLYGFDVMTWRTAPGAVTAPAAAGPAAEPLRGPRSSRRELSGQEPRPR